MAVFGKPGPAVKIPAPKGNGSGFVGVVGRQSKRSGADGKSQGIHHHPQMMDLGRNVSGGLKPRGSAKKQSGGYY